MQRANVKSIAAELDISRMTVYRVINNTGKVRVALRNKVISALNRHRFYGREWRNLRQVLFHSEKHASYHYRIINAIAEMLLASGCTPVFLNYCTEKHRFLEEAERSDIIILGELNQASALNKIREANPDALIINLFGDPVCGGDIIIAPDDFQGGTLAAQHFLDNGHRRHIAIVTRLTNSNASFLNRYRGFVSAIQLKAPQCRIECLEIPVFGDPLLPLEEWFRNRKQLPTAFFCAGLVFTRPLLHYFRKNGIKSSVLGFDHPDESLAGFEYDRIVFEVSQIVEWAVFLSGNRPLFKTDAPVHILVNSRLEVHGSVQNINQS